MALKSEFAIFMSRLAKGLPRFAPKLDDNELLNVWFDALGHLSSVELTTVYKKALSTLDQFPSIRELLEISGAQSAEDSGREVAERIFAGLGKFGDLNGPSGEIKWSEKIAPFIGPIGVEVVKLQGGWNYLCSNVYSEQAPTWKAQWRGLAETLARKGSLGESPQWDSLPPSKTVTDAIKQIEEMRSR